MRIRLLPVYIGHDVIITPAQMAAKFGVRRHRASSAASTADPGDSVT